MIDILFSFGAEHILVRIEGNVVTFGNTQYGAKMATIDGLKISQEGCIKEFPDLKDNPEWKSISIQRFKDHISNLRGETERAEYIMNDLKKWGYVPRKIFKQGFRPEVIR